MKKELEIIENKIHPKVRLNSVCPYFTMFPLTFPYKVLINAKRTDIVCDQFCGRGTTNFAARLLFPISIFNFCGRVISALMFSCKSPMWISLGFS